MSRVRRRLVGLLVALAPLPLWRSQSAALAHHAALVLALAAADHRATLTSADGLAEPLPVGRGRLGRNDQGWGAGFADPRDPWWKHGAHHVNSLVAVECCRFLGKVGQKKHGRSLHVFCSIFLHRLGGVLARAAGRGDLRLFSVSVTTKDLEDKTEGCADAMRI